MSERNGKRMIAAYVDGEQYAAFQKLAAKEERTVSNLLRMMLSRFLKDPAKIIKP